MLLAKRDVLRKDMQKHEIEEFLKDKGDYVQMDHLTRFMKETLPLDTKKFVASILGETYEKRGMNLDAARMYYISATHSANPLEKSKFFKKEGIAYVKAGQFDKGDDALGRALADVKLNEKVVIQKEILAVYKILAEEYLKKSRLSEAIKAFEKIRNINITPEDEKLEIDKKLLSLYERLGRIDQYLSLRKKTDNIKIPERATNATAQRYGRSAPKYNKF